MTVKRCVSICFCACVLLTTLFPLPATAQTYNAEAIGRIMDPQGAMVPDAQVKAVEQTKGTTFSTVSAADGTYHLVGIVPGIYRLEVTKQGFQTALVPDLQLRPIMQKRLDVTLQVGTITQTVTVTDVAPTIETQKASLSQVQPKVVLDRPLTNDARGWVLQSMGWLPDSAPARIWNAYGAGHWNQQEWTLEGMAIGPGLAILPEMSVSELQLTTINAPAEFARPVTLNASFRGGTNDYHGAWEWTLNNPWLNAVNNPFYRCDRSKNPGGKRCAPATSVWYTLWRIGGPVRIPKLYDGRNKSFFHFSFHRNLDVVVKMNLVYNAPSPEMQAGNFTNYGKIMIDPLTGQPFPGNTIPASRINPITKKWSDLAWGAGPGVSYPSQTAFRNNANTLGYYGGPWQNWVFKFDQNIGQKDVLSFLIRRWPSQAWQNAPWAFISPRTFSRFGYNVSGFNLAEVHSFSPTIVNEIRLAISRDNNYASPVFHEPDGTLPPATGKGGRQWLTDLGIQGIPTAPDTPGYPVFGVAGWSYGAYQANPGNNFQTRYQLYDNLSIKRGSHSLKTGWYSMHYAFDARSTGPFWGNFAFDGRFTGIAVDKSGTCSVAQPCGDSYADFLLGYPGTITKTVPRAWIAQRLWELGAYFQDDWQVSRDLTLSLGIRWDTFTVPYDRNRMYYNFSLEKFAIVVPDDKSLGMVSPLWPKATLPVITASQAGYPKALFNQHHFIQPRFGFAWRPGGSEKSVIRGGYGVYSGRVLFDQLQTAGPFQLADSFPNVLVSTPTGPQVQFTFPNPFQGGAGAPPAVTSATGFNIDYRASVVQQANLTFERMLSANWGFRASYLVGRTTQMPWRRDLNQLKISTTPYAQSLRPYPQWQTLAWAENGANDFYQSLQFQVSHRWASGLWMQGSYQWRYDRSDVDRTSALGQSAPTVQYGYDRRYDYGRSGLFPTHDIVANWVYELPVGTGNKYWGDLSNRGIGGKLANALLGGWAASGTFTRVGGLLFSPAYSGYDPGNINLFSGRADVIPGCDPYAGFRDVRGQWYNPKCYTLPAKGTLGNAKKNSLGGPPNWIVILGPFKDFPMRFINETAKLRFGATIYNLFNHPSYHFPGGALYGAPANDVTSPDAGKIFALSYVRQPQGDMTGMRTMMIRMTFEF